MAIPDAVKSQIEHTIGSHKVVLYMKGNRHFPQCGFSSTVVGILNKVGAPYETVNVLADPQIRDGIKEFAGWPTIPQLYINGEFVGGCDIVKDMFAKGALQAMIGAAGGSQPAATAAPATAAPATAAKVPTITISPAAARAFADAAEGDEVLRLAIDAQFENDLAFGPKESGDIEVKVGDLSIFLDPASALRADGMSIDFVNGPHGAGFKLENPNEPPKVKSLSAVEVKKMLDEGKVTLFDVRPEAERAVASIAQARSLDAEGMAALLAMPKDAPIAFHCHHGVRSRNAAEKILREGFRNLYNLEGGIDAWSATVDRAVPRY
jgi:monothiol glutaredoxin